MNTMAKTIAQLWAVIIASILTIIRAEKASYMTFSASHSTVRFSQTPREFVPRVGKFIRRILTHRYISIILLGQHAEALVNNTSA